MSHQTNFVIVLYPNVFVLYRKVFVLNADADNYLLSMQGVALIKERRKILNMDLNARDC